MLLAALENVMKSHSKPQKTSASNKMVLWEFLRLPKQDTLIKFSADAKWACSIALCQNRMQSLSSTELQGFTLG